ncbi:glycosyltransferase family 9 protein [Pedobacter deserti]|uniref:glycosyltransferase family 9 protein n=1 Tax=Pedobacter deserti TaxID=2817382 RepID=UPI00210B40FA|nr:glycosyltransferase family 9 protein [Pedobacter sp. SYSU D00382]
MARNPKILVIRLSAMGDAAMVAPVLQDFKDNYPGAELVMLSRSLHKPFFSSIEGLTFHDFHAKDRHKGLLGIFRLFLELRMYRVTAVADLHQNIRSTLLRILFALTGVKVAVVDKGRAEKKRLTRKRHKILLPLKPTVNRYAEVFAKLGFAFQLKNIPAPRKRAAAVAKRIGISPFAQHLQKIYPLDKMYHVVCALADMGHEIFVFGGTPEEAEIAGDWSGQHPNISSMVRKITLEEELEFMKTLDLMVSMDSSGMHLASLAGVPVVSVWGATHPYAGFLGYGQSMDDAVQLDLYCRPCSVYGNKPCYRGDLACMNNLPENVVIDKIVNKLKHV